ncbi:MAG: sel1 repeat family protein [Candidatus Protochlamydia sp.]|nr:sel1 repeat family protein [Candidatus Protochlamydia sp.]
MQTNSLTQINTNLIRPRDEEIEDKRNPKKQKMEIPALTISPLDTSNAKPLSQLSISSEEKQNPAINSIFSIQFESVIEYKNQGDNCFEKDQINAFQYYMIFIEKNGPQLFPQSNADFYTKLGNMWFNGWGCQQNYSEALKCYEQAFQCVSIDACKKLGEMHLFGYGVIPNGWKAIDYLQNPELQEDPNVLLMLGDLYFNITLGNNNYFTTGRYDYFTVDPNFALIESSVMYLNELEGRKNNELAWSCYSNAANKGNAEAWLRLGLMLISGVTLSENMNAEAALTTAVDYFFRSVEGGCLCAYNSLAPLAFSQGETLLLDPQKMQFLLRGRDSLLNINQRIENNIKQQYKPIIGHLKNNFNNDFRNIVNIKVKEQIIQQVLDKTYFELAVTKPNKIPLDLLIKLENFLLKITCSDKRAILFFPKKIFPSQFIKLDQSYRFDYLKEWALRDATSLKMAISNFLAAEENQMFPDNWDGSIGHEITNMPEVLEFLKTDKKKGHLYAGIVMKEVGPGWEIWNEDILSCITQHLPKNDDRYKIYDSQRSISNLKLVSKTFNDKINVMISNLFKARFDNRAVDESEVENFFKFTKKFKNVELVVKKYSENIFQHLIKKDYPHITQLKIRFDAGEYMTLKVLKPLCSKLKKLDLFCDFKKPAMSKLITYLDLANNNTLKKLVLRAPSMDNAQLVQFGKSLKYNSTLKNLHLISGSLIVTDDFHKLLKNNSITTLKVFIDEYTDRYRHSTDSTDSPLNPKIFSELDKNRKLIDFILGPFMNRNEDTNFDVIYSELIKDIHAEYFQNFDILDYDALEDEIYNELVKLNPFLERNREIVKNKLAALT